MVAVIKLLVSSRFAKSECMAGWHYLFFAVGSVSLVLGLIRFFWFPVLESPKYLVSVGRNADAIAH